MHLFNCMYIVHIYAFVYVHTSHSNEIRHRTYRRGGVQPIHVEINPDISGFSLYNLLTSESACAAFAGIPSRDLELGIVITSDFGAEPIVCVSSPK